MNKKLINLKFKERPKISLINLHKYDKINNINLIEGIDFLEQVRICL